MHEVVANVYRGQGIESVHHGSIAVVNEKKEITHYAGDPDFFSQARSEAKPFQIIPLLQTGAADHFGFSDKQLAIMCGSHNGTDEQIKVVQSNLELIGFNESYLQCGVHQPMYQMIQNIPLKEGEAFRPLQHNCSGKHSGFLALAKFINDNEKNYLDPKSETQKLILNTIAELYDYPKENIKIGVDGCSAPVFGMPLRQAAIAYVCLANQISENPEMRNILKRVKAVITAFPEMVSGEGRFDLALARTFPGNIVNKIGAEGIEGLGFENPKIGIAVKILDGNTRALYPVVIEVLRQLGLLDGVDMVHLKPFVHPKIFNSCRFEVGEIVADFKLKSA